jgi:hypothetical protein
LAETTLSATALRRNPEEARRVRDVVLHVIDPNRFPWVADNRPANEHERQRAIVASAVMVAANRAATARRGSAKQLQESRVKEKLRQMGFVEVHRRNIPLLDVAPAPGEFCPESRLGDTRSDLVVRLYDRRVLAIECKVPNSAVNSFKRLKPRGRGKGTELAQRLRRTAGGPFGHSQRRFQHRQPRVGASSGPQLVLGVSTG